VTLVQTQGRQIYLEIATKKMLVAAISNVTYSQLCSSRIPCARRWDVYFNAQLYSSKWSIKNSVIYLYTLFLQGFQLEPQPHIVLQWTPAVLHRHFPFCWQVNLQWQLISTSYREKYCTDPRQNLTSSLPLRSKSDLWPYTWESTSAIVSTRISAYSLHNNYNANNT